MATETEQTKELVKTMSNCSFANQDASLRSTHYTKGRVLNGTQYKIDTITLHEVWGHFGSLKAFAKEFQLPNKSASSNYGIIDDGTIGMFVEECNRAWTSSSSANDVRAITVELNNDRTYPNAMPAKVIESVVKLCIDVCQRNGIRKMIWINDKTQALTKQKNLAEGEGIFTVHRWFANTTCPGDWLMGKMQEICNLVNEGLGDIHVGDIVPMEVYEIKEGYAYGKVKTVEPTPVPPTPPTPAVITVGSNVTINPGAKVGGLTNKRGEPVNPKYANGKYVDTVNKIETHKGVQEGRLQNIVTWVALSELTLVQ